MTRKLKTLGVALIAVFALTAVMASGASAEKSYTATLYPTTGTGTSALGNDIFTTEGGTVECASHFVGTLKEKSNDLTITATMTGCKAFGFLEAKVTGCVFTFTTPFGSPIVAPVDVVNPCTIEASTCHVTVPVQTGLAHIGITNNALDVSILATLTGITYTVTKDGFLCPFNGTGAKTGGTYKQVSPVTFASTNGARIAVG
jgi:hypothetical protein